MQAGKPLCRQHNVQHKPWHESCGSQASSVLCRVCQPPPYFTRPLRWPLSRSDPCPHFVTLLNGKQTTRLRFENCSGSEGIRPDAPDHMVLFPYGHFNTATPRLTLDYAVYPRGCWPFIKPSGHYMYHQFNIQQFHVLPTQCIYVFCVDMRTNSDYFPVQH